MRKMDSAHPYEMMPFVSAGVSYLLCRLVSRPENSQVKTYLFSVNDENFGSSSK